MEVIHMECKGGNYAGGGGGGGYGTLTPIKSMCPGETSDVGKKVANTSI